ncbi:hypothetical protein CFter6_0439 [Collimonas fungivorans]|uniref:Uncharacterized protein n=1 Tax=Collimonas fungivorans TaxID=158899 RepID=A0A127P5Q4_9BURK|nr:hypothetical protein CFter6_0439 [Collimonas fungivorans]
MKKMTDSKSTAEKDAAPDRTVLGAERSLTILSAFIDSPNPSV